SREALEAALDAYEGTIITISHDRYFLDRVATQILALDGEGIAEHYYGDYTEYHDWKAARIKDGDRVLRSAAAYGSKGSIASSSNKLVPSSSAGERSLPLAVARATRRGKNKAARFGSTDGSPRVKIIKKARQPETVEAEISELESHLSQLSAKMARPEVARDITKLVQVNDEYQQTETRLAELYDEWERAESTPSSAKR
ncbi:MAG: hypothetical protein DMF75_19075, partial [Acidobacteria bacterium]